MGIVRRVAQLSMLYAGAAQAAAPAAPVEAPRPPADPPLVDAPAPDAAAPDGAAPGVHAPMAPKVSPASTTPAADPSAEAEPPDAPSAAPAAGPPSPALAAADPARAAAREAQAAVAVDPKADAAARRVAVGVLLADGADALPFLRAIVVGPDRALAADTLAGLGSLPVTEALALARLAAAAALDPSTRLAAVTAVERLAHPEAGAALWAWSSAAALSPPVRRAAESALLRSYPEVVAARGRPGGVSSPLALVLATGAGATTTGTTLAGVGQLTDNGAATAVGGVGGAAIGGTLGLLWAREAQLDLDAALSLQTGAGWGVAIGALVGEGLRPATYTPSAAQAQQALRRTGLSRMAGALGGAGVAAARLHAPPTWQDSLAASTAGGFGVAAAAGLHALRYPDCVPRTATVDGVIFVEPCAEATTWSTRAPLWGAGGAAVGLGAAWALEDRWSPTSAADPVLWAVGAGALGRIGGELDGMRSPAADGTRTQPFSAIGAAAGFATAALTADLLEPTPRQAALAAAGLGLGMVGGEGIEQLSGLPDGSAGRGWLGAGLGLGGAAAGLAMARPTAWSPGDRALVGVGAPVAFAWSALWEASLVDQGLPVDGLALTSGAALSVGVLGLSRVVEPEAGDVALLGAGAAWGASLGVMAPLALDVDDPGLLATTTVAGSQLLAAATAAAVYSPMQLEPRRTLKPQLGGLVGLTSGALIGALVAPEAQAISVGGLLGVTLGAGAGAGWEHARPAQARPSPAARLRQPQGGGSPLGPVPSFAAAPALIGDELGVTLNVGLHGW